jgi:hypothetical protein
MKLTRVHMLWRNGAIGIRFRCGVSLHSHTLHSRENMAFIPRYTAHIPLVGAAIRAQERRYFERTGRRLDFARAFWRPPLAPREAHELEARQIEGLGLHALVSLSDHDDIEAGARLAVVDPRAPVSIEWTVPFGPTFFHVGIHNLPRQRARAIAEELAAATADPARERVRDMLAGLQESRETLIVWNHPLWDEACIGAVEHAQLAGQFGERFGEFFHALELNGLRPWSENQRVTRLAEGTGHALVSGGDRHGLEPNANLNVTNAASFAEFAEEVRRDGRSEILFMPQYREPLRVRMIETMCDIVREYPQFPDGRRRWSDRVFYEDHDGVVRSLSEKWKGAGPWPVEWFLRGLRAAQFLTTSPQVRGALKVALADARELAS